MSKLQNILNLKNLCMAPFFEPLISAVAIYRNLIISEIPGDEPARIGGEQAKCQ